MSSRPGTSHPVNGYASKGEACFAMFEAGSTKPEIADELGITLDSVHTHIKLQRKKPGNGEAWTVEKRDKARRVFAASLDAIAGAIDVPVDELVRFVMHGIVLPTKANGATQIYWRRGRPDDRPVQVAPSRADDEAALAALSVAPDVTPPETGGGEPEPVPDGGQHAGQGGLRPVALEPTAPWLRLKNRAGEYLNLDCTRLTRNRDHAWIGTRKQAKACIAKFPQLTAGMRMVAAESGGARA